jgi:hypothetical protein
MADGLWRQAKRNPGLMIRLLALIVTALAVLALIGLAIAALA